MIKLQETENLKAHDLFDAVLTVLETKERLFFFYCKAQEVKVPEHLY